MYNNEIHYRSRKDYEKILGKEFVRSLAKKYDYLNNKMFRYNLVRSDCPLIWSDIICDFICALSRMVDYDMDSFGNTEILQIKEKFGRCEIYLSGSDQIKEFAEFYKGKCAERTEMVKMMFSLKGINVNNGKHGSMARDW
jgi:hypothetical protein